MLDRNKQSEFFKLTNLFVNFIEIFKNMLVDDIDYFFDKIKNKITT